MNWNYYHRNRRRRKDIRVVVGLPANSNLPKGHVGYTA